MSQQKINTQKRNKIIACFCKDITAVAPKEPIEVNRNTVNYYHNKIR